MPVDASHFSMVGFPIEMTGAGLSRAAQTYLAGCTPSTLDAADVVCLVRDPSGGELSIGLRKGAAGPELETMNPGFAGEGRTLVEIASDVSDPAERPFEITLAAHFAGEPTPLAFDLAEPGDAAKLQPGAKVTIDIAAFTFEPHIYADEATFYREQATAGAKVQLAANYFIPSGMFFKSAGGEMPDGATRPVGYADFAGRVLKSKLRTNQSGSGRFWWALVQTYDSATVDVVMDPSTVHGDPKPGAIISGRFWLSARILPSA
jgi:hypothetical protein